MLRPTRLLLAGLLAVSTALAGCGDQPYSGPVYLAPENLARAKAALERKVGTKATIDSAVIGIDHFSGSVHYGGEDKDFAVHGAKFEVDLSGGDDPANAVALADFDPAVPDRIIRSASRNLGKKRSALRTVTFFTRVDKSRPWVLTYADSTTIGADLRGGSLRDLSAGSPSAAAPDTSAPPPKPPVGDLRARPQLTKILAALNEIPEAREELAELTVRADRAEASYGRGPAARDVKFDAALTATQEKAFDDGPARATGPLDTLDAKVPGRLVEEISSRFKTPAATLDYVRFDFVFDRWGLYYKDGPIYVAAPDGSGLQKISG